MLLDSTPDEYDIIAGTIDEDYLKVTGIVVPSVEEEIFLEEKAPWLVLQDDPNKKRYDQYPE